MRHNRPNWNSSRPRWNRGPGSHIGFRIFGFMLFLLVTSAIVGGLLAWVVSPGRTVFLVIGFSVIVVMALVMRAIFRRSWGPVSELIDATTRLGEGDTSVRMEPGRSGPWAPVTSSFNGMAARLEAEHDQRRRLLADLGHEMRTPLTVIRGEIEAVLDGIHPAASLRNVIDEVELMERLLGDLRTLALTEAGELELLREPTDISELTRDAVSSFSSLMTAQDVELEIDLLDGAAATVDPHRMHQVISNLVSNALAQMQQGGTLHVGVTEKTIVIADTGPGIPSADLPHIFDRFTKAADSAGSGLGLSIAKDLVEAHGGNITVTNRPDGGAQFRIELV